MKRPSGRQWFALISVALLIVATAVVLRSSDTRVVAYFPSASGLYVGDPVKVMGVAVGTVQSVVPDGDRVRVVLGIDAQPIPVNARAAIVAPSLVSARFVQLAPAYTRGPRMESGAVIPLDHTAIPVSFDDVKRELTDLASALGPKGDPNGPAGSLDQAIRTLDANLSPDAATNLRSSLAAMRGATESLASGGEDLFSTLQNLNTFVKNLAVNDRAARELTVGLAGFTGVLDQNRHQLGSAIGGLAQVLVIVRGFVKDNGSALVTGVLNLEQVAKTVASRSNALAAFLQGAPTAVDNLYNVIERNAVTARLTLNNIGDLAQLICGSVLGVGGTVAQCKAAIAPLLDTLGPQPLAGAAGLGKPKSSPGSGSSQVPGSSLINSGLPLLSGLLASLTGGAP